MDYFQIQAKDSINYWNEYYYCTTKNFDKCLSVIDDRYSFIINTISVSPVKYLYRKYLKHYSKFYLGYRVQWEKFVLSDE